MKKLLPFLLCAFLCLASFTVISQTDFMNVLEKKLENYTNNYPEKIFVHTDKPFYSTEDNLWYTAYLVNGISHQKSEKSKIVHVELIDNKDSIVANRKLYVQNTSVAGDFKIGKDWKSGTYTLRAYTKYMKNHENDYFFQQQIPIYAVAIQDSISETLPQQPVKTPEIYEKPKKLAKPTLNFYPEGGYLINDTQNKVAFEIKDNEHEISLTGTIKDNTGQEILTFKTLEMGLGSFLLIPEKGKTYYASIQIDGNEVRYPLPKTLDKGYVLNTTNTGQHIIINIGSTMETGLQGTYLIAHERGRLLHNYYEETTKSNHIIKIATKELNNGIINITLFDKNAKPVAERLVFIDNPEKNLNVTVSKTSNKFNSRKQVTLKLKVQDNNGTSAPSSLSMAIRDLKAYPYNHRTGNIESWLLLNSDLKGTIKNPGYFFEKKEEVKRRYLLDLVMMTKGWRRFTWQELMESNTDTLEFSPEKGLYISGVTKELKKPYTEHSSPTRLTFFGKTIIQEPIQQSDSLGKFKFGPYIFFDSIPVLLEARMDHFKSTKRKSRNIVILVDKERRKSTLKSDVFFNPANNTIEKERRIENFIKVTKYIKEEQFKYDQEILQLSEVTLVAKRKTEQEKREDEMNSLTDYGEPVMGQRLDVLNDYIAPGSYSAFDIVSRMNGISTYGDSIYMRRGNNPAKIVLDGLEVDGSFLRVINGDEISFIDILSGSDAATFSNAGGGVVALYSNSGNVGSRNIKRKPGIIDFQAEGFYTARQFYKPDHINGFEEMNRIDLRTTLHWEPTIRITEKGDAEISFFTSDIKSDYLIEIQGISDSGIPIHATDTFVVE
ncbi:hypothetical protein Q4595_14225 [Wenyingzhuangia sp. 1_MG-2023]|nr:hypothetical protein [Wenyingzhuangia sp. 1_MG-2023]